MVHGPCDALMNPNAPCMKVPSSSTEGVKVCEKGTLRSSLRTWLECGSGWYPALQPSPQRTSWGTLFRTFTPSVEPLGTFMLGAFGFRAPQGPCTMHFSTASCAAG